MKMLAMHVFKITSEIVTPALSVQPETVSCPQGPPSLAGLLLKWTALKQLFIHYDNVVAVSSHWTFFIVYNRGAS
jgi:hypothetical protein